MKLRELVLLDNAKYLADKRLPITVTRMRYSRANETVPPHTHEFAELTIVAKGKITHFHDGKEDKLHAGDFFIIHPGAVHAYDGASHDILLYNLLFDPHILIPALVSARLPLLAEIYPGDDKHSADVLGRLSKSALRSATTILDLIGHENARQRKTNAPALAHLFAAAIAELSSTYVPPDSHRNESALFKVCTFIDANLTEPLTISRLAQAAGMSPRTLQRLFNDLFGADPSIYIQHMRTARAEALLASTDQKLAAIASNCGFHDASHMSKTFKRLRGVTPGEIRRRANNCGKSSVAKKRNVQSSSSDLRANRVSDW